ncbi:sentrin-specific protease 2-like [Mizuhopecten yessoensis]|uniref:sentrin-specific protease 2-like n=1 Tax=Mizuhopecten yessoensis TaxID=6573 RepID=UPI000B459658|nr:sentrin-specific protease 2-like [Mizuhopecten yessoensis]
MENEYTLQLAASVLTFAFHEKTDITALLETVRPIPFSTAATQPMPIPRENVHVGNVSLSPNDLRTLRPMAWLNDQVVHAYLGLLSKECNDRNPRTCHILPSFLALKWETENYQSWLYPKVPLENFCHVLLPICHQQHWFLLVASMITGEVTILDSVPSESRARTFFLHWMKFMDARLSLLDNENPIKWTRGRTQSSVQEDGSSCGVFVLMVSIGNSFLNFRCNYTTIT